MAAIDKYACPSANPAKVVGSYRQLKRGPIKPILSVHVARDYGSTCIEQKFCLFLLVGF
jgi:hypothetical protein